MSLSLLELTQNYFLGSTGRQASLAFGESEPSLREGLQRVIPLALGGLLIHAQRPGGAAELAAVARQVHGQGLLGNLSGLLGSLQPTPPPAESALADRGAAMLHSLLGSDYSAAAAGISQQTDLRPATVRNLLSVVVAVALGLLGRHAAQQNLAAPDLANYLASQRDAIGQAVGGLPGEVGCPLADLLRSPASTTARIVAGARNPADRPVEATTPPSARVTEGPSAGARAEPLPAGGVRAGNGEALVAKTSPDALPPPPEKSPFATPANVGETPVARRPVALAPGRPAGRPVRPASQLVAPWRWLFVLGLPIMALLGYFGGKYYKRPAVVHSTTVNTATPIKAGIRSDAPAITYYEEASDTSHYDPGPPVQVQLPTGNQLRMGVNTAEAQLFYLLTNNPRAQPDRARVGIRLAQVAFGAGTATLTAASQAQLANLAALLQAFPRAQLKIGGFTDNQGSAEASLLLSADRANAVRNTLLARGVAPSQVAAQGYGQTHPLVSNDTRAGRAQNRRVAILLISQ